MGTLSAALDEMGKTMDLIQTASDELLGSIEDKDAKIVEITNENSKLSTQCDEMRATLATKDMEITAFRTQLQKCVSLQAELDRVRETMKTYNRKAELEIASVRSDIKKGEEAHARLARYDQKLEENPGLKVLFQ